MLQLSTRILPVHRATSAEEREAIQRFRYAVHVDELERPDQSGVDHERGVIVRAEDEEPGTTLLYVGEPDQLDAVATLRRYEPGRLPAQIAADFAIETHFVDSHELIICEVDRILARPDVARHRGLAVASLLHEAYVACIEPPEAQLIFFALHPGLVRHFGKLLGARRYGGGPLVREGLTRMPVVLVPSDHAHLQRVGSLLTPLSWKHFVLGRRPALDARHLPEVLQQPMISRIHVDEDWAEIEERHYRRRTAVPSFFEGLRGAVIDELMTRGEVTSMREGQELVAEGKRNAEMYVVLEGAFDILVQGKSIDFASEGELLGELAVLSPTRQRSATIRALTSARVLKLDHTSLRNMALGDPEAGHQVMFNLSSFIANRFAEKARLVAQLEQELERLQAELDKTRYG